MASGRKMGIGKGCEADEQSVFIQYLEIKRVPFVANINENIWSGIIKMLVRPPSKAMKIIYSIENKMKMLGKRKGVVDMFIPVMSKGYGGMWIEFKYGSNKTTKEQDAWLVQMRKQGYYSIVCYSAKEAIEHFVAYTSK